MGRSTAGSLTLVAAIALGGCSGFKRASTSPGGKGIGGAGGTSGAAGTGGLGGAVGSGRGGMIPVIYLDGGADSTGADRNCGEKSKTATKVPPEILILLDRSGSMNEDINGGTCNDGGFGVGASCGATSKWALMVPAINQVVMETEADVDWGLKFFPDSTTNSCNVSTTAAVPVGAGSAGAIASAVMASTSANGGVMTGYNNTPTRSAMVGATTYLQSVTTTNPKFILLATDGVPTCSAIGAGGMDDAASEAAVAAANTAGFKTFVVGIATGGSADLTLSRLANAGGLPRQGTPSYYSVSSAADLAAAVRTFISAANTCTFQVGPAPTDDGTTDVNRILVYGDGVEIKRDTTHTNGYDYTDSAHQSIEVHGPLCDQIKSGAIKEVSVNFICLTP
jgi:hypothetical protein